jgi:hypothetical protein
MMHVYSDGSVKYAREEGTWAPWEAYIAERPDRPNITVLHLVAAGDGKEIRAPEATERVIRPLTVWLPVLIVGESPPRDPRDPPPVPFLAGFGAY